MADIIEEVRVAIRRRVADKIIDQKLYQRQWMDDAPIDADVYIRETIMEEVREEIFQKGIKSTALVQFDIFVRRGAFPNPLAIASDYAGRIFAEFNPQNPDKVYLQLSTGQNAHVEIPPYQDAPAQEEEWFHLPVLFSVGVFI